MQDDEVKKDNDQVDDSEETGGFCGCHGCGCQDTQKAMTMDELRSMQFDDLVSFGTRVDEVPPGDLL